MTADPRLEAEHPWDARRPDEGWGGPRSRLLAAGRTLLFEHGNSAYSIAALTRRAGVALNTFYRSFASKDEFLQAVFISLVAGATPSFRERVLAATEDPLDRLRLAVQWAVAGGADARDANRVVVAEHLRIATTSPETIRLVSQPYEDLIRELATDATGAGAIAPADLDSDIRIITTMVTASFHAQVLGLTDTDRNRLAMQVWRFCLAALRGAGEAEQADGPGLARLAE